MSKGITLVLGLVFVTSLSFAASSSSSHNPPPPPTIYVNSCVLGHTGYPTIQSAVDAAPAGATILVCPGDYPEQVTITKALNIKGITAAQSSGFRIITPGGGVVQNATSVGPTPHNYAAQVLVQNAKPVNFTNMTVDGLDDGIPGCDPYLVGVLYQNASGAISYSAVLNQILGPALTGCQGGLAILVQSGNGGKSVVDISNSVVQNFAKNGITATEVGTKLTVETTAVTGIGFTDAVAQNGVEFGFGATGSISDSSVADLRYSDAVNATPIGILLVGSPNVTVKNNVVTNTDTGIGAFSQGTDGSADNAQITGNEVSSTHTFDGVVLCSNNSTASSNSIKSSDEAGVFVGGFCIEPNGSASGKSNKIKSNEINRACAGVEFGYGATPGQNTNSGNTFSNTDTNTSTADSCPQTLPLAKIAGGGGGGTKNISPSR